MTVLAVAALSARAMAEAARRDGFGAVALDLFGDADTRRAASRWCSIGSAETLRIDPDRTLAVLRDLADQGGVDGWVAGSGFEGQPDLVAAGAALLPLIGTAPESMAAVRDSVRFFGLLASQGIDHPPVCFELPADRAGWLIKDTTGCGGHHIRRLSPYDLPQALSLHHYLQHEQRGLPMSATFVADGRDAVLFGFNAQIVKPVGRHAFMFCGVIGPVPLAPAAANQVRHAVSVMTREFGLRGVCGLDFLLDGNHVAMLEVNPRPPASMALYAAQAPMAAHWRACVHGELPSSPSAANAPEVNGTEIVFAERPLSLDAAALERLTAWPSLHDVPFECGRIVPGQPLCSVSATGSDHQQVRALLTQRRRAVTTFLETRT